MKKISINSISVSDKDSSVTLHHYHAVYLGNNIKARFKSIIQARKFLADTNRFLNQKLYEINEVFIEVNSLYLRFWFVLNDEEELNIRSDMSSYLRYRDLVIERSSWENGNLFAFSHLLNGINSISSAINVLINYNKRNNKHLENYQLQGFLTHLLSIREHLESFGSEFHME